MPAYVIVDIDVTDPERYEQYKAATPATLAAAGGRFLVRGGEITILEGDWQPSRLVVLEFENLAAAERWYESAAYQAAKKLRDGRGAHAHGRRAGPRIRLIAVVSPVGCQGAGQGFPRARTARRQCDRGGNRHVGIVSRHD